MAEDDTSGRAAVADREGRDFVFVAGAPGSKWSALAYALTFCGGVDTSDLDARRTYPGVPQAHHVGSYFGPGMEYGNNFNRLGELNADELFDELTRPFSGVGLKILKSHSFSRHLADLEGMFPFARFVVAHRPDDACLAWWLEAGGFDISYPDYSYYREVANMQAQIELDNRAIEEAVSRRGLRLSRRRSLAPLLQALGLTLAEQGLAARMAAREDSNGADGSRSDSEARAALLECGAKAATAVWGNCS